MIVFTLFFVHFLRKINYKCLSLTQFLDFRGFRPAGTAPRIARRTEIGIGSIEGFMSSGPITLAGFIL